MKTYFKGLIFLIILISACTDSKKEPGNKNESIDSKDSKPADLASKGVENLSASFNTRDIICQAWDYTEDVKGAVGADPSSNIDFVHRGFSIYKDGSMIKDQRGNMLTGKWSLDDKATPASIIFFSQ